MNAVRLTRMEVRQGRILYPDTNLSNTKNIKSNFILVFRLSDRSGIHCTRGLLALFNKKTLGSNKIFDKTGHERPSYGEARGPGALVLNVVAHRQLVVLVPAHAHKYALNHINYNL